MGNFQLGKTFIFPTLHLVGAGQFVRVGPLFSGTIDLCKDQKEKRYSSEILNSFLVISVFSIHPNGPLQIQPR